MYFEVGRFSTSVGCNTLFGEVDITEESLGFSLIATTLMGCPEEEDEREQEEIERNREKREEAERNRNNREEMGRNRKKWE